MTKKVRSPMQNIAFKLYKVCRVSSSELWDIDQGNSVVPKKNFRNINTEYNFRRNWREVSSVMIFTKVK